MTPGHAALVGLLDRYLAGLLDPFVSPLEGHKLLYFLQEAGEPLVLPVAMGTLAPDAEDLRQLLGAIAGYVRSGPRHDGRAPDDALALDPDAVSKANVVLSQHPRTRARFERVASLVEGFESPFGLELLATVHWVATREGAREDAEVVERTSAWGSHTQPFSPRQAHLARRVLVDQGWLASAA